MRCLPGAGDDENHSEEQCERDLQRLRRVPSLKRRRRRVHRECTSEVGRFEARPAGPHEVFDVSESLEIAVMIGRDLLDVEVMRHDGDRCRNGQREPRPGTLESVGIEDHFRGHKQAGPQHDGVSPTKVASLYPTSLGLFVEHHKKLSGIGSWLRCWLNGVIHAGESRAQGTSASGKTLES